MKYTNDYMYSKDIDWFCVINKNYIHVASAGGILPEPINNRDKLRKIQKQVFDLPHIFTNEEIIINQRFLNYRFDNEEDKSNYLQSFIDMAKKGFISMDRTNLSDLDEQIYHIVCMPASPRPLEALNGIFKIVHHNQNLFSKPIDNIPLLDFF